MSKLYTWGVPALDDAIGRSLAPGTVVTIAGPPGAGKTILASTVCYHNALQGRRCIYFSFQEHEDKYYRLMQRLGMDFTALKRRGLFRYEEMPLVATPHGVQETLRDIGEKLFRLEYDVVVLDSITPIAEAARGLGHGEPREVYANFFYNLARLRKGLFVLIAEAKGPRLDLAGLEYVSDVVLVLKYRLRRGFMNRFIEIRKARGSPIHLAEIPFAIIEGRGIVAYTPPPLIREVPSPSKAEPLMPPCKSMREAFGAVPRGSTISVFHQPDARGQHLLAPLLVALMLSNRVKVLFVSYAYSPDEILDRLLGWLPQSLREKVKEELLGRNMLRILSLNPGSLSLSEIYSVEMSEIEEFKPDLVVFDRTELPYLIHGMADVSSYIAALRNELLALRSRHITVVRVQTEVDKTFYRVSASLSNIVTRLRYRRVTEWRLEPIVYVWRENSEPRILSAEVISACMEEARSIVEEALGSRGGL